MDNLSDVITEIEILDMKKKLTIKINTDFEK